MAVCVAVYGAFALWLGFIWTVAAEGRFWRRCCRDEAKAFASSLFRRSSWKSGWNGSKQDVEEEQVVLEHGADARPSRLNLLYSGGLMKSSRGYFRPVYNDEVG